MHLTQRGAEKAFINALIRCSLPQGKQHAKSLFEHMLSQRHSGLILTLCASFEVVLFLRKDVPMCHTNHQTILRVVVLFWSHCHHKPPSTNNGLSASRTDADYQLCTDLQRKHFNRFFTVCHILPINPILSSIHIEFRVMAKHQAGSLDHQIFISGGQTT